MAERLRVLRSRTWNVVGAATALVFAAVCGLLGILGDRGADDYEVGVLFWGLGAAVMVAAAVRVLMVGVVVTPGGLTFRELFRTRTLPWAWLSSVDVLPNRQEFVGGPTIYNPTVHYAAPGQPKRQLTLTALGAHRL